MVIYVSECERLLSFSAWFDGAPPVWKYSREMKESVSQLISESLCRDNSNVKRPFNGRNRPGMLARL